MSDVPENSPSPSILYSSVDMHYAIPLPFPGDLDDEERRKLGDMVCHEIARMLRDCQALLQGTPCVVAEWIRENRRIVTLTYHCSAHPRLEQNAWIRAATPRELYEGLASVLDLLEPAAEFPPYVDPPRPPEDPSPADVRKFRAQGVRDRGGLLGWLARILPDRAFSRYSGADHWAQSHARHSLDRRYASLLEQRFAVFGAVSHLKQRYRESLARVLDAGKAEHAAEQQLHPIDRAPLQPEKSVSISVVSLEQTYICKAVWRHDPDWGGFVLFLTSSMPELQVRLPPGEVCPLTLLGVEWEACGPTLIPRGGASFFMASKYFTRLRRK